MKSFPARLRYNQAKNQIPILLNDPIYTARKGFLVVLLEENDYYVKYAEVCKYTLVGMFRNTMPKIELLRKSITLQIQLMGSVKITHFNSRHLYIDLDNEFYYQIVWTKHRMNIERKVMRIHD